MLRNALLQAADTASSRETNHEGEHERKSLVNKESATENVYYDQSLGDDDDDDLDNSDGNDTFDDDDDSSDNSSVDSTDLPPSRPSIFSRCFGTAKRYFLLFADVENLWDSPETPARLPRRNHIIIWFWFIVLTTSYTSERSSFKLLVDWSGPFRLVAAEMVTFFHALLLGAGILLSSLIKKEYPLRSLGIPIIDVGLMALLDTVHILLVFLSGIHVPPTLTVILVQFVLPLSVFLGQFVHSTAIPKQPIEEAADETTHDGKVNFDLPYERNVWNTNLGPGPSNELEASSAVLANQEDDAETLSMEHIIGSVFIFFAVLLALCPAIYSLVDPDYFKYADAIPMRTAWNTIIFVSSCIPAAASQLYKERIFLKYKQPVQPHNLNFVLSVFQFTFASIIVPLVYPLQGLGAGADWATLYPPSGYSQNIADGMSCFFRPPAEQDDEQYTEQPQCSWIFLFVVWYTLSVISVGVAVDRLVNAGATKLLYRGISAAVIVSVICLYTYDMHIPDFNYGPAIDSLNLGCLLLLVIGSEIYHRVSMPLGSFETIYPEVEVFYDDDDD